IMQEILSRTGDYGCPAGQARMPGVAPRHARVVYLCSPAAGPTVARARAALGETGRRVEIRRLPPGADMAGPAGGTGGPARGAGPVIRRYLGVMAVLAALRLAGRLARAAAVVLLVVAAAPVSLVAALAVTLAWLGGWPPRRLYRAALACLPMVAVWLVAAAIAGRSVPHAAAAPYQAWLAAWHQLAAGSAAPAPPAPPPPPHPPRPGRGGPRRAPRG